MICDVDARRMPLSPARLIKLCGSEDLPLVLARIARVRPDFYLSQSAAEAMSQPDKIDLCDGAAYVLRLAHQETRPQSLSATSTGIFPQDLNSPPLLDAAGQSLPPTDLSSMSIRMSGRGPDFDAFCAVLQGKWQRLTCDHTVGTTHNTLMISCPQAPLGTAQVIANLFQASFQTLDWRDDPLACGAAHGIDVELGGFISWPKIEQIDLALGRPVVAETQAHETASTPPEPFNLTAMNGDGENMETLFETTRADLVNVTTLLEKIGPIPIKLQFLETIDQALCHNLIVLGFHVTCDTIVSESRRNRNK